MAVETPKKKAPEKKSGGLDIGSALKKKGPGGIPAWGLIGVAAVGIYAYRHHQGSGSSSAGIGVTAPAPSPGYAGGGPDPGGGGGGLAPLPDTGATDPFAGLETALYSLAGSRTEQQAPQVIYVTPTSTPGPPGPTGPPGQPAGPGPSSVSPTKIASVPGAIIPNVPTAIQGAAKANETPAAVSKTLTTSTASVNKAISAASASSAPKAAAKAKVPPTGQSGYSQASKSNLH